MSRPERRGRPALGTVEVKRIGSRTGHVLEVGSPSLAADRHVLESAFDIAGRLPWRRVHDPGWWAALVAGAYVMSDHPVSLQRVVERLDRHVVVWVEPGRLVDPDHPHWPLVELGVRRLDLRGEAALALGPSDEELSDYVARFDASGSVADLRRAFDLGVLEWVPGDVHEGRRRLRPVGR